VLIVVGALAALALIAFSSRVVRMAAVGAAVAALLAAPAVWAFDTLGHATSGTFPAGGPASAESGGLGGPGGGFGGPGGFGAGAGRGGFAGPPGGAGAPPQLFGSGQAGTPVSGASRGGGGALGAPIGGSVSSAILSYVKQHGGGTIAVASQSNAASSIVDGNTNVAGIGGFSGRESDVSVSWLAQEVRAGKIRWVLDEQSSSSGGPGGGLRGDTRTGAKTAMAAVARECEAVTTSSATTLYDCAGRAAQLASAST
jgi:hypothetical protein